MFSLRLAFAFSLTVSLLTSGASAAGPAEADSTVQDFRKMSRVILTNLQRHGYSQFGSLNLAALLRSVDQAEVVSSGWFHRAQPVAGADQAARSTAEWSRTSRGTTIRVNRELWNRAPVAVRSVIALHEHLGPAGFNDLNYRLSTLLWFLSQNETARLLTSEEKGWFQEVILADTRSGGGITGVGGGGDTAGVAAKVGLIKRDLARFARARGEERLSILRQIFQKIDSRTEVRWSGAHTQSFSATSSTPEVARDMLIFDWCKLVLAQNSSYQRQAFTALQRQSPQVTREFGSFAGMMRACSAMVRAR